MLQLLINADTNEISNEQHMLPNDPLYQMVPTKLPQPWNKIPMFQIDGDDLEYQYQN